MKQLSHDVRISYINNDDAILQNCYTHQFSIDNPDTYSGTNIRLVDRQEFAMSNCNYLYLTASQPVRIIMDGSNELIVNHLSYVNLDANVDFLIQNLDNAEAVATDIQILYGRVIDE